MLTGEAVALDLPVASVGIRAVSGVIDLLLAGALLFLGIMLVTTLSPGLDGALMAVAGLLMGLLWVSDHVAALPGRAFGAVALVAATFGAKRLFGLPRDQGDESTADPAGAADDASVDAPAAAERERAQK